MNHLWRGTGKPFKKKFNETTTSFNFLQEIDERKVFTSLYGNFDEVNDKNQWRKILLILRFLGSFEEKDPCRPARQLSYSKTFLSMY